MCLAVVKTKVKSWMEETAEEKKHIVQQDGAAAHSSHFVQNWLSDNLQMFWSKEFWPPPSPDLNPLDHYVYVLERDSNKTRNPTEESLRAAP